MPSANVTRRALTLGSRETTTGWRAITYSTSTIEMIIQQRGATYFPGLPPGVFSRANPIGWTADTVAEGDQIQDSVGNKFEIVTIQDHYWLDSFYCRECLLHELPIWQASPSSLTWSKTRLEDPRERTKVYIDTHVRDAQITKDDDSTQADWACIFSDPLYPLKKEFRASSNPVHGLYVVDMPNSTALMNYDQSAYGYEEHVPIHISTVDSTACTGTALAWKMEAELRYVCETYPLGSQRNLERRSKNDRALGSMWLYDQQFLLEYTRHAS